MGYSHTTVLVVYNYVGHYCGEKLFRTPHILE